MLCGVSDDPISFGIVDVVDQTENHFEPERDKTSKMNCVPSEDSDQPGHPPV